MLHGREKMGASQIDWQQYAFGRGKYRRKTISYWENTAVGCQRSEPDHEIHIRELSIVDAGIGCAVWDAAIILSRWVFDRGPKVMAGQTVLELGSGVGLPGLMAARFAERTWLTDYLPQLLLGLEYNLKLNDGDFCADAGEPISPSTTALPPSARLQMIRSRRLADVAHVALLDWNKVHAEMNGLPFEELLTTTTTTGPSAQPTAGSSTDVVSSSSSGSDSSSEELEEEDDPNGNPFCGGFNSDDDDDAQPRASRLDDPASKARRREEAWKQRQMLSSMRKAEREAARQSEEEADDSWIRPRFLTEVPAVDIIIGSELTYTPANLYNLISVM